MASEHDPIWGFLGWFFWFGWEGPLAIYLGVRDEEIATVFVGLFFTWFFWHLMGGLMMLKGFIAALQKEKS